MNKKKTKSIDLNTDLGEYPGEIVRDLALMDHVSSCNIACGGHAGDRDTMLAMLRGAKAASIAAGAHPSYPDRANFGRQSMEIETNDLIASIVEQISGLAALANEEGVELRHIKPHGALYNDLAARPELAQPVAEALSTRFPDMSLVGLAHGAFARALAAHGETVIAEAFIDRAYTAQRHLVPRSEPGAVIAEQEQRIAQAINLARGDPISSNDGKTVKILADSLCIHSDSPGAIDTARQVRQALHNAGIQVASP